MRKHTLPKELANLTPAELAEVNEWLRKHPYIKVQQLMLDRFGCKPSLNKLCRYYQRLQLADEISASATTPASVHDIVAIENGEPLTDEQITSNLKLHALRIASAPDIDATGLTQLFHLFTYDDRRKFAEHRFDLEDRKHDLRERRLQLKARIAAQGVSESDSNPEHTSPE